MHKKYKYEQGGYMTALSGNLFPLIPTIPKPSTINISAENQKLQSYAKKLTNSTSSGANPLNALGGLNGGISAGINAATGLVKSLTPQAEDKGSQIGGQVISGISDVASMIPGIGTVLGAGLKGLSALVTSIGPNVQGNTNKELTDSSASYGGLGKLDSKKFGLFGIGAGKRYRNKVAEREQYRGTSESILRDAKANSEAAIGSAQNLANKNNLAMMGGWQQNNGIRFGKVGTKIEYSLDFAHKVLNHLKERSPEKFENGGKMNVIPEGALHARKHNMDDSSLNGKITEKGIPVIRREGGDIEQFAEIEKNEIIFTKEVTESLEKLRDIGTSQAAIEAGKLLVQEILYNTKDNTGLLNTIE